MPRNAEPPTQGILPSRFKVIDYVQDKIVMLWDMGDVVHPKLHAEVWCGMEYWTDEGREDAKRRLGFICGVLNGSRPYHEVLEQR